MQIAGADLLLRFPERADAPRLFELARDPEVTRFFSWGPYDRVEQAEAYLEALPDRREAGELLDLAIVDPEHGVVGITGLSSLSLRDRRAIVGTWLGREHWGSGVNARSKALVAALAFDHLGLERLGAYAAPDNPRSQPALERLGFRREGVLRAFHRHGDEVHDVISSSLLRSEYEAAPWRIAGATLTGELPPAWVVR